MEAADLMRQQKLRTGTTLGAPCGKSKANSEKTKSAQAVWCAWPQVEKEKFAAHVLSKQDRKTAIEIGPHPKKLGQRPEAKLDVSKPTLVRAAESKLDLTQAYKCSTAGNMKLD
jgi:hypothetical protein